MAIKSSEPVSGNAALTFNAVKTRGGKERKGALFKFGKKLRLLFTSVHFAIYCVDLLNAPLGCPCG